MVSFIPRVILHHEATEMLCRESKNKSRRQVAPLNMEVPLATSDTESTSAPPVAEGSNPDVALSSPQEKTPSFKKQVPSPEINVDVEAEAKSSDFEELPSIGVPSLLRAKAQNVAKRTEKVAKKVANETVNGIVSLPHEASRSWGHLSIIVAIHAFGPVLLAVLPIFLVKLTSVNGGLSHNRVFLYGTHTFVEFFIIAAFIQTCHFAVPSAEIPVMARTTAILVGLAVGKAFLAFIAEAWWSKHADPVFPIPFSFIGAAVISLPCSLWTLQRMTPKRKEPAVQAKLNLCVCTLLAYMFSLFLAGVWGVVFQKLQAFPKWQMVWGVSFQLFEFVCKIVLIAPLATKLNAKRWIQLSLVVDLILVSVHTAMLPYFASLWTVVFSWCGTLFSLLWRAYCGVDRVMILRGVFWRRLTKSNSDSPEVVTEELGAHGLQIPTVIARASVMDIHQLSMRLHGHGAARSFQEWAEDSDEASLDPETTDVVRRSSTEEIECLYDCDSVDSLPVDVEDSKQPGTPETVAASTDLSVEPREETVVIDRRKIFANSHLRNSRHSGLVEFDWRQRHCYHIVDSVSSAVLSIVVRLAGLITSGLVRTLPVSEHLNTSFQISDEQWHAATIYVSCFLGGTLFVILVVRSHIFSLEGIGGLTLNRVISYMFRDHFWFFFSWFCITQALVIAMMLNHFGADFSLDFDWLSCRGEGRMAWPGCVSFEPSV